MNISLPEAIQHYELQDEHLHIDWTNAEILDECIEHHVVVPICAYASDQEAIVLWFFEREFLIDQFELANPSERKELSKISMLQYAKAKSTLLEIVQQKNPMNS